MKTSKNLEKIIQQSKDYIYGGRGFNPKKFDTLKWTMLKRRFEKECKKIKVNYKLFDFLA